MVHMQIFGCVHRGGARILNIGGAVQTKNNHVCQNIT